MIIMFILVIMKVMMVIRTGRGCTFVYSHQSVLILKTIVFLHIKLVNKTGGVGGLVERVKSVFVHHLNYH